MKSPFKSKHWDFWKNGVSSSLIDTWQTCKEQFRLEVCKGWRNRREPFYFAYGTCVHWMLHRFYGKSKPPGLKGIGIGLNRYEKLWLKECPNPSQYQMEQQERVYRLAEAVLTVYFKFWAGDWKGYRYPNKMLGPVPRERVMLEDRFKYTYTFPDGKELPISGTRDFVFRDRSDKKIWILDTKNLSVVNEEQIIDTLQFQFQPMLYCYTFWKQFNEVPAGFIINLSRRPGHRQKVKERPEVFYKRIHKDVAKRPEYFFQRFVLDLVKKDLINWEKTQLVPVLQAIRDWWEGKTPHYMTASSLVGKYGQCRMYHAMTKGDFTNCYQRDNVMDYQTSLT